MKGALVVTALVVAYLLVFAVFFGLLFIAGIGPP